MTENTLNVLRSTMANLDLNSLIDKGRTNMSKVLQQRLVFKACLMMNSIAIVKVM